ncbi:MAG: hypothetical protein ABR582_01115 [Gemmatimonadaceae bacterium]
MKPGDVIETVKRKVRPPRKKDTKTILAVTAGVTSAIWFALRLRKDLYGPGGTKLSRYNRSIDKPWPRDKD